MLLVIDPSCADCAEKGRLSQYVLKDSHCIFRSGSCLTRQLLGHVLEVLVAVTVGSDQGSGFGITYERARISQSPPPTNKILPLITIPMYCEDQTGLPVSIQSMLSGLSPGNIVAFNHTFIWWMYSCGNLSAYDVYRGENGASQTFIPIRRKLRRVRVMVDMVRVCNGGEKRACDLPSLKGRTKSLCLFCLHSAYWPSRFRNLGFATLQNVDLSQAFNVRSYWRPGTSLCCTTLCASSESL